MIARFARATTLCALLALALSATAAAPAGAQVPASSITSPANNTNLFDDGTLAEGGSVVAIQGTAQGISEVDIRCYYGAAGSNPATLATKVPVVSGAFSTSAPSGTFTGGDCVLRAVPTGNIEAQPNEAGNPFQGPAVLTSEFGLTTNAAKLVYDYSAETSTLGANLEFSSAGDCGLDYSYLFNAALTSSGGIFYCNAELTDENIEETGSEVQVDGANGYATDTAQNLVSKLKGEGLSSVPGQLPLQVTKTYDPATGLMVIHESDPIVKCVPGGHPANKTNCEGFAPTGVTLERTWQTTNADAVALMTDTWRSTDGAAHALNVSYFQELESESVGGSFQFPGSASFQEITTGEKVPLPAGAGTILYKSDKETPDGGDGNQPQGAIVYDIAPSAPWFVGRGSSGSYNYSRCPTRRRCPRPSRSW